MNPKINADIIVAWMNSEIFTDDDKFAFCAREICLYQKRKKINFYIFDLNNILDQKPSRKYKEIKIMKI